MKITTLRTTSDCADIDTCPSLHRTDTHPDGVFVISKRVDNAEVLAAFASKMAPDEILGFVPNDLLPEV